MTFTIFFFVLHYTSLEQPPTPWCLTFDTGLCNLLFCFMFTASTLTPVFRHVIYVHTPRRVMLQERSEHCFHEEEK